MKTRYVTLFASIAFAILSGCASESSEDASESEGAAQTKQSPPSVGTYALDAAGINAVLTIRSVAPFTFDLSAVTAPPALHMGELQAETASVEDGKAVFNKGDDCILTFEPKTDALVVVQTGSCVEADFGHNVDASGTYRHKTAIVSGAYALDTAGIKADLTIKSVVPFRFDLSAVTSAQHIGDLQAEAASLVEDGKAVFKKGEDCTITFESKESALVVEQVGSCMDADFGQNVYVSGTYRPAR